MNSKDADFLSYILQNEDNRDVHVMFIMDHAAELDFNEDQHALAFMDEMVLEAYIRMYPVEKFDADCSKIFLLICQMKMKNAAMAMIVRGMKHTVDNYMPLLLSIVCGMDEVVEHYRQFMNAAELEMVNEAYQRIHDASASEPTAG